jgi:hypothetical protein
MDLFLLACIRVVNLREKEAPSLLDSLLFSRGSISVTDTVLFRF